MSKHFILMWGLKGCIPLFCEAYAYKQDAIEAVIDILDLPRYGKSIKKLKKFNYVDINDPYLEGIEYIEMQVCNCENIGIHAGD